MSSSGSLRTWMLMVGVWAAGSGSLAAILVLHQRADRQRQGQVTIERIGRDVGELPSIAFSASPGQGNSVAQARARLRPAKRVVQRRLASVKPFAGDAEVRRLNAAVSRFVALMDRLVPLAPDNRADEVFGQARRPGGAEFLLASTLATASADHAHRAREARRLSDAGTVAAITLLLLGFSLTLSRALRARRQAEGLAVDNARLHRTSRQLATTDALTGLANRRKLEQDLATAVDAATPDAPVSLLFFDLNGFKTYNDTFGHHDGDLLLQRLSRRLQQTAWPDGEAYRLGGDEFCAVVPGVVDRAEAMSYLDALADRGEGFDITSSYGQVLIPLDAASSEAALQLADQRMYADKTASRVSAATQTRDVALRILDAHEPDLHDHSCDVASLAEAVGLRLGLQDPELGDLVRAAELHDIGKVAIPFGILHKDGPLDEDEWRLMRRHPTVGAHILRAAPALAQTADIVAASHEHFDGMGYPHGLAGDDIPLESRIVLACDAFSAMTTDRSYRRARSTDEALREMHRSAGTQFDPTVVETFDTAVRQQLTPLA